VTPAQAVALLRRLQADVAPASRKALTVVGAQSTRLLREGLLSGQRLNVRSGRLRNSVASVVTQTADGGTLEVSAGRGADVKYARILERGGTIRPTRGRFLAIPQGRALTGAGVTRGGWESPRTAPAKLRFVPISGGRGLLVEDRGARGRERSDILYLLVQSVRIRGRFYMRTTREAARLAYPALLSELLVKAARSRA
jgi:hypothetical protein